ncbi:MAG: efflux transporter outer membrane subunit [Rhodanobacteraceae bacterium]|nr:MAG: efflux transporter outer membrane subunit [Rhodanobacteraceae bacterium]
MLRGWVCAAITLPRLMPAFVFNRRLRVRLLGVAALCVALGACVSVEVPPLPAGDLPAHWRNAPALGAAPDLTGWWTHFDDPTLDTLVAAALRDNPGVQQARLKVRAARALEDAAMTALKPQLAFKTLEQPNPENTASYFQAGFDASWELGLFGRAGATRHLARADAGAAAAELADARVSLVAEVVREYLGLRAAQRSAALLDAAAQAAQRKAALLKVRERLQLASGLEVAQAAATAATAQARLADPRAAVAQHAQALALLLGKSEPERAWLASAPVPSVTATRIVSVPADLLRTRPDIRYAEAQVVKAAGALGIARADLYPRLALGSSLTFAALVTGHTHLGDVNNSFSIGPIVNIPLFDWGQRRAVRSAREDQLQAAVLAYREAVLKGAAEVETALAALHAAGQRARSTTRAAAAAQRGVVLSGQLQHLGQADGFAVADAQLAATASELDRVHARLAQDLAYVALYKALGGAPLPAPDADTASRSTRP